MLVDSHCHLTGLPAIKGILGRARAARVGAVVNATCSPPDFDAALSLARSYPEVKLALGVHPADCLALGDPEIFSAMQRVKECAEQSSVVAFGETGLDYKYGDNDAKKGKQARLFSQHIALSKAFDKAVVVHSRRAERPVLEQLEREAAEKVLLHWFCHSKKLCALAAEKGWFMSVGPSILFDPLAASVSAEIPLDALLLETDAPVAFGAPPSQPQPAEPSWIPRVAAKIAELQGVSLEDVEAATTGNAVRLFGAAIQNHLND